MHVCGSEAPQFGQSRVSGINMKWIKNECVHFEK